MNVNLEEEADKFCQRMQEISFSKSKGFQPDIFSNSMTNDRKKDESVDYFLGATTRRKLLDNINDNGRIVHPREDDPVQFSIRDNNELSKLEKHQEEEEKKINLEQPRILNLELVGMKFQDDHEEEQEKTIRNPKLWKSNFFIIVYLVTLFISNI